MECGEGIWRTSPVLLIRNGGRTILTALRAVNRGKNAYSEKSEWELANCLAQQLPTVAAF